MDSDRTTHEFYARFDTEQAGRELKSALTAGLSIGAASFIGHEVIDKVLPESSFSQAAANTVLALGGVAAGVTLVAGSISALRWKLSGAAHLKTANEQRS